MSSVPTVCDAPHTLPTKENHAVNGTHHVKTESGTVLAPSTEQQSDNMETTNENGLSIPELMQVVIARSVYNIDDLRQSENAIATAALYAPQSGAESCSVLIKPEPTDSLLDSDEFPFDDDIPPDFFDDLLKDEEIKYSEKSKLLQLELHGSERDSNKNRISEKSRKRSENELVDASVSWIACESKRKRESWSGAAQSHPNQFWLKDRPRITVMEKYRNQSPSLCEEQQNAKYVAGNNAVPQSHVLDAANQNEPTTSFAATARAVLKTKLAGVPIVTTPTLSEKRKAALHRCAAIISEYEQHVEDRRLYTFTKTARKRKTHHCSPLLPSENVSFEFNTLSNSIGLNATVLEQLPPPLSAVARWIGCDIDRLMGILKTVTIPDYLLVEAETTQTINPSTELNGSEPDKSASVSSNSIMTQTDKTVGAKGKDIATQFSSVVTKSSRHKAIVQLMPALRSFNENQLMAVSNFIDLIVKPADNAVNMLHFRKRVLDIYKSAQLPFVLGPQLSLPSNRVVHDFSRRRASYGPRARADPRQRADPNVTRVYAPQRSVQNVTAPHGDLRQLHNFAAQQLMPQMHLTPNFRAQPSGAGTTAHPPPTASAPHAYGRGRLRR